MIPTQHICQEDMLEMLHAEGESEKTRSIGDHLQECAACRKALEDLAAKSLIWKKAPALLRGDSNTGSCLISEHRDETTDFVATSNRSEEATWQYPIDELLDPPQHPEMMGRIGKYDVEREVGRGGMGVVLKAHDAELNRPLAIKILAPHLASHGTARKRFAQEAIAAAGVLHPNVIAVHGVNNEGKTPYIVMPYVSGPSLQTLVDQQGPLTEIEITRIALQISAGLAAAHSQGLVHRDIKPANILVESGVNRVLITDFGLARAEDDASLTRTGWLTGTPNYMSPEQTRGERPDQRSDLFSLGSLIYFLATGRLPFRSESPLGVLNRIQNDEPTPVRQINNQISQTLADVISCLFKKKPDHRFQSAADLHDLLEKHLAYLHQPDISKPPKVQANEFSRTSRPSLRAIAASTSLLAAICLLGYFAIDAAPAWVLSWHETAAREKASQSEGEVLGNLDPSKDLPLDSAAKSPLNLPLNVPATLPVPLSVKSPAKGVVSQREKLDESDRLVAQGKLKAGKEKFEEAAALYRKALDFNPENDDAAANLGYALHMQGKLDEALPWHQRAARSKTKAAIGNYNLGCYYSLKNEPDKAFDSLKEAIKAGLAEHLDPQLIKSDPDLERIRGDKRYADFIEKIDESNRKNNRWGSSSGRFQLTISDEANHETSVTSGSLRSSISLPFFPAEFNRANEVTGKWHGKNDDGIFSISIEYAIAGENWKWVCSDSFQSHEFSGMLTENTTDFSLKRAPGLLKFQGKLSDGETEGEFRFAADKAYRKMLVGAGVDSPPDGLLFRLFLLQDEKSYLDNLTELKKLKIKDDALQSLMVDATPAEFVKSYLDAGLSVSDHLPYVTAHVDPELILAYHDANLDLEEYRAFALAHVSPDLIKDYQTAGLDLQQLKSLVIGRVPPQVVINYRNASFDLQANCDLMKARVPAAMLGDYTKAGLSLTEFRSFLLSQVPAKLLMSYRAAGLDPFELRTFLEERIDADFLLSYLDADLDLKKNAESIRNRVDPAKAREIRDRDPTK